MQLYQHNAGVTSAVWCLGVFLCLVSQHLQSSNGHRHTNRLSVPPPQLKFTNNANAADPADAAAAANISTAFYSKQQLDHFNPFNTQTWSQRYFTNTQFYKPGGPVFLMINSEGAAVSGWLIHGQWYKYAKQNNALMFLLEHRFYGASQPTK